MLKFKILAVIGALLALSACSDKKKSPPDDDFLSRITAKASIDCTGSFTDCATAVLSTSTLSEPEKKSLSGCDFEIAKPTSSPVDVFEVSKQAVKHSCQ
jgi:hypothetical protein